MQAPAGGTRPIQWRRSEASCLLCCAEAANVQGAGLQVLDMGSHMLPGVPGSHMLLQVLVRLACVPALSDSGPQLSCGLCAALTSSLTCVSAPRGCSAGLLILR